MTKDDAIISAAHAMYLRAIPTDSVDMPGVYSASNLIEHITGSLCPALYTGDKSRGMLDGMGKSPVEAYSFFRLAIVYVCKSSVLDFYQDRHLAKKIQNL